MKTSSRIVESCATFILVVTFNLVVALWLWSLVESFDTSSKDFHDFMLISMGFAFIPVFFIAGIALVIAFGMVVSPFLAAWANWRRTGKMTHIASFLLYFPDTEAAECARTRLLSIGFSAALEPSSDPKKSLLFVQRRLRHPDAEMTPLEAQLSDAAQFFGGEFDPSRTIISPVST